MELRSVGEHEYSILPMLFITASANQELKIWDLLEDHHLFDGRGPDGGHSDAQLLAEIVAMLGPPPTEFLRRSPRSLEYWDTSGTDGLHPIRQSIIGQWKASNKSHPSYWMTWKNTQRAITSRCSYNL